MAFPFETEKAFVPSEVEARDLRTAPGFTPLEFAWGERTLS